MIPIAATSTQSELLDRLSLLPNTISSLLYLQSCYEHPERQGQISFFALTARPEEWHARPCISPIKSIINLSSFYQVISLVATSTRLWLLDRLSLSSVLFDHGRVGSHRRTGRESWLQAAGSRQTPEPYLLARGVWERTVLRCGGLFDAIVEVVRGGEEVHALVILGRIVIIYE